MEKLNLRESNWVAKGPANWTAETSQSVLSRASECKPGARVQVPGGHDSVYSLPVAAITNEHKLGGFEQKIFILSQSFRPEV